MHPRSTILALALGAIAATTASAYDMDPTPSDRDDSWINQLLDDDLDIALARTANDFSDVGIDSVSPLDALTGLDLDEDVVERTSEPELEAPKPVSGSAKTYAECSDLLARSGSECQKLPEWSKKYPDLVRYKCKDEAVKIGDACFSTVRYDGSVPYPWTFNFPKVATPTTSSSPAASTSTTTPDRVFRQILVNGYARRLWDCEAFRIHSEYECRVIPETRPDNLQTRSDCKAAVAPVVRACNATMAKGTVKETFFNFRYNWVSTPAIKVDAEDPTVTVTGPVGSLKFTVVEAYARGEDDCKKLWGEADKACEEVPKSPREDGLNWDTYQACRESMAKSGKMCYQTFREKPGVPRNERFSFAWVVPGTLRMKVKEVKAPWM
ncbi:hypothetical protein HDU96_000208 [Phlyctochytrium bullatum]|nr:hypothetical protein HDU96_000208 [Phlyctochytrium bullatum]